MKLAKILGRDLAGLLSSRVLFVLQLPFVLSWRHTGTKRVFTA